VMDQCRTLSETNLGFSRELQKAKLMIETLEAVLMMLYTHPSAREVSQMHHRLTGRDPSAGDDVDPVIASRVSTGSLARN
jgi:hypothetical protein